MLAKARENLAKLGDKLVLQETDVQEMKFQKGSFDAAFASFSLHHIPDEKKLESLSRIRKTLKKGGVLHMAHLAN